jgi:hypothetical protein
VHAAASHAFGGRRDPLGRRPLRQRLLLECVELVGEPVWAAEAFGDPTLGAFAWFFVRAPDGRVFAIEQVPDQPWGAAPRPRDIPAHSRK